MNKNITFPKPKDERTVCKRFIETYQDELSDNKYMNILQDVANRETSSVNIELDDVLDFEGDANFVNNIKHNTLRYVQLFEDVIEELLPVPTRDIEELDVLDVLLNQRLENMDDVTQLDSLPPSLRRRYMVNIIPQSNDKNIPLREIKAENVGQLVKVRGVITRMTDVKPLIKVATYTCDVCGHEVYQEVNGDSYTPLKECMSESCRENQNKGKLYAQTRGSKFLKIQRLKLQELPGEVPVGHIPRSINIVAIGDHTRKVTPGDIITLSGMFLVRKRTGFRARSAGLIADTYLQVMHIENNKKSYSDMEFNSELEDEVLAMSNGANVYTRLAKSIAPEIYGHDDVKKALLLLLVGANTRVLKDGMRIRGDINVLLLGDPGVAKSQLLKHISSIAPRGVYTTGKGSSGVGLTAAVTRDPITKEVTLEGGALVLADMGVCCIDEFDKMEEGDRTAIYEVMEQQTVSIAKAGITTTLNARASVLAAANPRWGRYDPTRTPELNINLPTALLSRFDLTFIMLDQPDEDNDKQLAEHITYVHRFHKHPALTFEPFSSDFLRTYIAVARRHNPYVPRELANYISGTYVQMRSENDDDPTRQRFCTARSLLSILRLSQALARLRFSDVVEEGDVVEASRLLWVTKYQLLNEDEREAEDVMSSIFKIIQKAVSDRPRKRGARYNDLVNQVAMKGYTEGDLKETIEQYEALDLISLDSKRERVFLVSSR